MVQSRLSAIDADRHDIDVAPSYFQLEFVYWAFCNPFFKSCGADREENDMEETDQSQESNPGPFYIEVCTLPSTM